MSSNSFCTYRSLADETVTSDEDKAITSDEDEVVEKSFTSPQQRLGRSRSRYNKSQQSQSDESKTFSSMPSNATEDSIKSGDESVIKSRSRRRLRILSQSEEDSNGETESGLQAGSPKGISQSAVSTASESDHTEDEAGFEHRAFSPKTRMSITGVYPRDMSDNDSDFILDENPEAKEELPRDEAVPAEINDAPDSNDEAASALQAGSSKSISQSVVSTASESDHTEDEAGFENRAFSPKTRMSITGVYPRDMSGNDSDFILEKNPEAEEQLPRDEAVPVEINDAPDGQTVLTPARSDAPRLSVNFNCSISQKMSSTIIATPEEDKPSTGNGAMVSPDRPKWESPVSVLPAKCDAIEISSDSDGFASTPGQGPAGRQFIQPKILSIIGAKLEQTPLTEIEDPAPAVKYVSQDHYESELKKLSDLKAELSTCENLINTLGSKLPDKGKRMSGRGERLKQEIEKLALHISTLKVDTSFQKEKPALGATKLSTPTWEELTQAANAIKPTHTGKVGMANFVAQKTLTIERLKDIHGSIETCPAEHVLAENPKFLKIVLMNHQRHALAWMNWREQQTPRGGILADDMGLGKTLTMISLVLACKYKEEEEKTDDSDDGDSDYSDGWCSKGKSECYYGGTLVVCPASLIRQWEEEVQNRVNHGKLEVCVYHGHNRESRARRLSKHDMVITTYNLVSRELKTRGTLYAIKWERVILDEAHVIRNHKSQASEAACKLRGKRRWILTGTPIHNKEMDLYPLLKFLKCSPFDELSHWKRWIDNKSSGGQQRLNTLMKSLMLRRTKQQLQVLGSLTLPERTTQLIEVTLDKEEMFVYQKVLLYSRTLFAQFLHQRAERNADFVYAAQSNRKPNTAFLKVHEKFAKLDRRTEVKSHDILLLLLRLRQVCCHPGLIDAMLEDDSDAPLHSEADSPNKYHEEIDLLEQLKNMQINDESASAGLSDSLNGSKEQVISKALSKALLKSNPVFDTARLSSKMKKVIELVDAKLSGTVEKALIVSQWTSVLNILKTHLAKKGISTVSLDGTVPVKNRNDIVNDFNSRSSEKKIMLLSLTAGGVGLNLVGANHLLLVDLHWNPQLEAQAQDRIYRVGQKHAVNIYKFMCKDTVEERIKALQDEKLQLADGVLTGVKAVGGSKLSIDDLKSLFGL